MINMTDVIVIGAGPAGLTAALYLKRAGKNVIVFEAVSYGGRIINAKEIENYPAIKKISGFDYATNLYNQVKDLGVEIKFEKVTDIKVKDNKKIVTTSNGEYECKSIIIATGVENRKLGLPNEEEWIGKGISYCATCDGAFYKNKVVAVNGGGNTAIMDALELSEYCKKVYLIYRNNELRGEQIRQDKLKRLDNVEIIYDTNITALLGNDKLESLELTNKNTGSITNLEVSGLFIAIGQIPSNKIFENIIKIDDNGYILGDDNCHTNIEGIYVAGDTRKKDYRQLTTAVSDGTIAALSIIKELNN